MQGQTWTFTSTSDGRTYSGLSKDDAARTVRCATRGQNPFEEEPGLKPSVESMRQWQAVDVRFAA
jgi:hypothetical protein